VRQRPTAADGEVPAPVEKPASRSAAQRVGAAERPRRLTFRERQELDALPASIEALETEQQHLYQVMADAGIYQQGGDEVVRASARLVEVERDLAAAYARWEQLETI
jgi:ATP-binding cassette subfamily F protein uup